MKLAAGLIFGLIFLLLFALLCFQINLIFKQPGIIFPLTAEKLLNMMFVSILTSLAYFCFVIFAFLIKKWFIILTQIAIATFLALILIDPLAGFVIAFVNLASLVICYLVVNVKMASYLEFNPLNLFHQPINTFAKLSISAVAISYFLYPAH